MHGKVVLPDLRYHLKMMRPLLYLSNLFIYTFGITQPNAKNASRSAWFIAGLMVFVLIAMAIAAAVVLHLMY